MISTFRIRFIQYRSVMALLACILFAANLTSTAHADDDQGGFVIRTAYTELLNGVYYLNADVGLTLSQDAVNALENGVPLTVEWQIEMIKHRSCMWNKTIATLTELSDQLPCTHTSLHHQQPQQR